MLKLRVLKVSVDVHLLLKTEKIIREQEDLAATQGLIAWILRRIFQTRPIPSVIVEKHVIGDHAFFRVSGY